VLGLLRAQISKSINDWNIQKQKVETLNGNKLAFVHENQLIVDDWISTINSMIKQMVRKAKRIDLADYLDPIKTHLECFLSIICDTILLKVPLEKSSFQNKCFFEAENKHLFCHIYCFVSVKPSQ
jgi:hypothetical protein